ncbi:MULTISPECIES: SRPBCC family protein [Actinoalloteichus]|uniref:Polyketide cyclase / dehydrase and lipid transport n=1 Tax=Actinoalloteichus fjordicus TaxID=1612552 RepID=A0AAC9LCH6_9PSEU|nr:MULTISPECIES: SRPBCC family protein [Actinoalloteichus]APU13885.1 Polyketide cyclase / dehydrase and lipid transport [Actinoalloteichus fjordicus]APU19831.1 Polyketide cyclase / dehydrase and lipid transport [Actinoalloteichus sp. GBA129-24]
MAEVKVTVEREFDDEVSRIRELIADYQETRPAVLPPPFSEYEVLAGGTGAGTRVRWKLQATKSRIRDCVLDVDQSAEGDLIERDANSSMVTTWTVRPGVAGRSRVAVTNTWQGAAGVGGFFERTFAPMGLRRIYGELLDNLARRAN